MKNILFVEQNQNGTVGGSHYCLLYLVQSLDRSKYNPIIMFYEDYDIKSKFIDLECNVIIYPKPRGVRFRHGLLVFQKIYNLLRVNIIPFCHFLLYLVKNRIDLIHLNNSSTCGFEWLFASKLLRKKCITHERGWIANKTIKTKFARYFDKIISVSISVNDQLVKLGLESKCMVLYDGMNPVLYKNKVTKCAKEMRNKFIGKNDIPFIGMVGNFQEWKGQMTVVKAVKQLTIKYPELVCLLIGSVSKSSGVDNDFYKRIIDEIEKLDLKKNIIITGYRSDIPDLVNSFDLFVHASIKPEPFGMVLLEAMCLGKAVIATKIGGPTEIIEHGKSGILVQPGDYAELAQKIDFLLENSSVRDKYGNNAKDRVAEKFSLDRFSFQINQFYNEFFDFT